MINIPVHSVTEKQIEDYLSNPAQVLAIIGQPGAGKGYIARHIASLLLEVEEGRLERDPHLIIIIKPADKQEIPIDEIRGLIAKLKIKSDVRRVVLIENAENLSTEAQNALLKTLEQPGANTFFILTITSLSKVLPTVLSRSMRLTVHPISLSDAIERFRSRLSVGQITAAWTLSEGAASLLTQTLDGKSSSSTMIDTAKDFLRQDSYGRLLLADKLSKDRQQ